MAGLALTGLVWLLFSKPDTTSFIASSLASFGVIALGVWLTFFRFSMPTKMSSAIAWALKALLMILFIAVAVITWPVINSVGASFLSSHEPQIWWLILDGIVIGSGFGTAFGTFRLFARYKNLVLAFFLTVLLVFIPFLILLSVGAFKSSFN